MRKKKLLLCTLFIAFPCVLTAQRQWTLQECIDYAMQNNITLQKSRLQAQISEEDVKGSKAALLPSLSASTNQSIGYRPWQDNGTTTVSNGQVNTKVDKGYYNGSYGLNAQWTVWNGNRNYNTLKQNKITAEQSKLEADKTANSVQEQIAQLYVQILYLTEALNVSEESLETSKKNEERGQQMVEVGKMSKADQAQLTAQRATDEYNITLAKSDIVKYKYQLKQLLQLGNDAAFDVAIPATSDEQVLGSIPSLQMVYEQALSFRPEVQSSSLAIQSSELSIKMAKAGYMPSLSLTAGLGTSTSSLSNKEWGNQFKTNFDASAGVTLSIPIFDQRQTKTAVKKARLQQQQAQLDLAQTRNDLYETIENYWLDAETNQQKFKAAVATEQSEQQSYNLLQEQFNLGLKNIIELMTGKDKLLSAQQAKLQSKYQTLLALHMLNFYQGQEIK